MFTISVMGVVTEAALLGVMGPALVVIAIGMCFLTEALAGPAVEGFLMRRTFRRLGTADQGAFVTEARQMVVVDAEKEPSPDNVARIVLDNTFRMVADCSQHIDRSDATVQHPLALIPIMFHALVNQHLLTCGLDDFSEGLMARIVWLMTNAQDGRLDEMQTASVMGTTVGMMAALPPVEDEDNCRRTIQTLLGDAYAEAAGEVGTFPSGVIADTVLQHAKDTVAWIDSLGLAPLEDMED